MLLYELIKNPILLILTVPAVIIALTFHEWAHGYVAYKCGDMTPRNLGRLSLNPMRHFDIFGALMMLLVGFGWAKPVPINPRNFRNPKWGFAIVAIAGPAMNLIIAFISVFLMQLVTFIAGLITSESVLVYNIFSYTCILFYYMAYMNVGFAVFNMIPIPPFDGSRLVSAILPPNLSAKYNRIEAYTRYIFIAVIALTWLPAPFSKITEWLFFPIDWLREAIVNLFTAFWELIF